MVHQRMWSAFGYHFVFIVVVLLLLVIAGCCDGADGVIAAI